jgi:opacity protein-like surface antigen
MKLKLTYFLSSLLILSTTVKAQTEDYPFNISFAIGTASMTNTMASNFDIPFNTNIKNYRGDEKLGYSLHLDYAMGEVISLGASFTYNRLDLFLNEGLANETKYTGANTSMGARFLFHLRGKNTKAFDPYLGVGYSLMIWSYYSKDVVAVGALADKINSMVPFTLGFRYYFDDVIGISTELSSSRASRVNLGLNFRF